MLIGILTDFNQEVMCMRFLPFNPNKVWRTNGNIPKWRLCSFIFKSNDNIFFELGVKEVEVQEAVAKIFAYKIDICINISIVHVWVISKDRSVIEDSELYVDLKQDDTFNYHHVFNVSW